MNLQPIILTEQSPLVTIGEFCIKGRYPCIVKQDREHTLEVLAEKRRRTMVREANLQLWS